MGIFAFGLIYLMTLTRHGTLDLALRAVFNAALGVLGVIGLITVFENRETQAIQKQLRQYKIYLIVNLVNAFVMPIVDLITMINLDLETGDHTLNNSELSDISNLNFSLWVLAGFQLFARFFIVYIVYGFYKRLEFGETLLTELGSRRLSQRLE
jgi:hypothetical protein